MSLDGKISNYLKEQAPISSDDDRIFLEDYRIIADAVMIGGNTLLQDDPKILIKREMARKKRMKMGKPPHPIKVGVVSNVDKIKLNGDFLGKGDNLKVIFTTSQTDPGKIQAIRQKAKVYVLGKKEVNLKKAMSILYSLGIRKLMVEGGGNLIFSLLKDNLVDEINLKIGDLILGGDKTVTLVEGKGFGKLDAKKVKLMKVTKKNNCLILKAKVIN
jgi:2,5-diamino-6-(ribosylamino)-4(3H)-pyrimidinone 5'-phosphate reductase